MWSRSPTGAESITTWSQSKMAASFAWLSVLLKRGLHVIKNRTIVKASWEESFGALVEKVGSEFAQEHIARIVIAKSEKFVETHEVAIDAPVSVCQMFNCNHVCIYLENEARESQVPVTNAFSVLMASSQELVLPPRLSPPEGKELRADQRLYNDVLGRYI